MKPIARKMARVGSLVVVGMLVIGTALADEGDIANPQQRIDWRDDGNRSRDPRKENSVERHGYFEEQHYAAVREYYADQYRDGRCPPGLARKNNGCLPHGQKRQWQVGRSLPSTVTYHRVPVSLVVQMGLPPSGYRYVRVAGDILLIAIGTGMIVDAIQDLGWM